MHAAGCRVNWNVGGNVGGAWRAETRGFDGKGFRGLGVAHTMKSFSTLFLTACLAAASQAALVEKSVIYQQGGATLEGFHVYDDAVAGKRPAILVVHQWTGLGDNEKGRSRSLAQLGYNVFAADVYGKGIRPQAPEAAKEAGKYKGDRALYRARLAAGLAWLKADARTEASKVAAIGYCFGGTGVLELARAGADVAGVVSFHGGLDAAAGFEAAPGKVKTKVLVLHGADDPLAPAAQVTALEKEFTAAKADWQVILYGGAVHAFTQKEAGTDASKGAAYNEPADRRSWAAALAFFSELFK